MKNQTRVSVIVPFRNESDNLQTIFKSLQAQKYPADLTEIIFIDDYSSDEGAQLIEELIKVDSRFKLYSNKVNQGKKQALNFGIKQAINPLILTTDADCTFSENWIESMVAVFESQNAHLVVGPVNLKTTQSLFGKLLKVEFAALIASTSGAIGIGKAFMCNGANLAFTKQLFLNLNPFDNNQDHASGDDIFLLHEIKRAYRKAAKIHFANDSNAVVMTKPASTFKEFVYQRIRWAGKSTAYFDGFSIFVASLIFITNFLLFVLLYLWYFDFSPISNFVLVFTLKWIIDFALLRSVSAWLKNKNLLFYSFLLSLVYPFYIVGIALLSLLIKPIWKGRKI